MQVDNFMKVSRVFLYFIPINCNCYYYYYFFAGDLAPVKMSFKWQQKIQQNPFTLIN